MHKPPGRAIFQRLLRQSVELVGYGKYIIHLTFGTGDRLSLAAPFRFDRRERISEAALEGFPVVESTLMRLIGATVEQAECDPEGTLELGFSTGDLLIVYANDPAYEAYTLLVNGAEYVV